MYCAENKSCLLLFPSLCVPICCLHALTNFSEDLTSVHVTKAQIHAWLEQIEKFKDLILFLKTSENELNYTTKQIDNEIAFNE